MINNRSNGRPNDAQSRIINETFVNDYNVMLIEHNVLLTIIIISDNKKKNDAPQSIISNNNNVPLRIINYDNEPNEWLLSISDTEDNEKPKNNDVSYCSSWSLTLIHNPPAATMH
jgi:hypothetical protein